MKKTAINAQKLGENDWLSLQNAHANAILRCQSGILAGCQVIFTHLLKFK